jgi:hypothetical protein
MRPCPSAVSCQIVQSSIPLHYTHVQAVCRSSSICFYYNPSNRCISFFTTQCSKIFLIVMNSSDVLVSVLELILYFGVNCILRIRNVPSSLHVANSCGSVANGRQAIRWMWPTWARLLECVRKGFSEYTNRILGSNGLCKAPIFRGIQQTGIDQDCSSFETNCQMPPV